jgi:hypothetical protein
VGLYLRVRYTPSWRAEGQHYILFFTLRVTCVSARISNVVRHIFVDAISDMHKVTEKK